MNLNRKCEKKVANTWQTCVYKDLKSGWNTKLNRIDDGVVCYLVNQIDAKSTKMHQNDGQNNQMRWKID